MKITIEQGTFWVEGDPVLGWIATATKPDIMIFRSWATPCYAVRGTGDTPTEALQDMLLNCWEEGGRWDELTAMLDAEFAGQEWWQEVKDMETTP